MKILTPEPAEVVCCISKSPWCYEKFSPLLNLLIITEHGFFVNKKKRNENIDFPYWEKGKRGKRKTSLESQERRLELRMHLDNKTGCNACNSLSDLEPFLSETRKFEIARLVELYL